MIFKNYILSILLLIFPIISFAQLTITNNSREDVYVAIGYIENDVWYSSGWWEIKIDSSATLINKQLNNKYYYYRAEGRTSTWEGITKFYVSAGKPFVFPRTMSNIASGITYKGFNQIDVGNQKSCTVTISSRTNYPHYSAKPTLYEQKYEKKEDPSFFHHPVD